MSKEIEIKTWEKAKKMVLERIEYYKSIGIDKDKGLVPVSYFFHLMQDMEKEAALCKMNQNGTPG